jgi:prepilin-type N-terminal cleavage/methylation domain-containing protein
MCRNVVSGQWSVVSGSPTGSHFRQPSTANGQRSAGYTLIELLLAIVVGSAVLAGAYSSYGLMAAQYEKLHAYSDVQERGLPTLRLISRDLRMAGHKELDGALESAWGRIDNPVVVVDSGVVCCDTLQMVYDSDLFTRKRTTYHVEARANPARNALYMDVETWDGSNWNTVTDDALVVDYIDDLQFETSDPNVSGQPQLMDMTLVLRSRAPWQTSQTYQTPAYNPGNSGFNVTDNYYREAFVATVNLRNLRQ